MVGQLTKGGLEQQLLYLIRQLQGKGVTVVCMVWNYVESDPNVKVYQKLLGKSLVGFDSSSSALLKIRQARTIIHQSKPQIVFSFTAFTNFPTTIAAFGLGCKVIGSLRSSAYFYLKKGGIKAFINLLLPGRYLVNSNRAVTEAKKYFLLSTFSRFVYFPNVLDIGLFNNISNTNGERLFSISVGNAKVEKKLDRLIEVFTVLRENGFLHGIRHYHVGDGALLEDLKTKVNESGLNEYIYFLGRSQDVPDLLSQASLFMHFSDYEGSPNVVMEAMAAGLPVISTDCGDTNRYIRSKVNGYLIKPYSASLFAERVQLVIKDTDLRLKMSKNSKTLIEDSDFNKLPNNLLNSLTELGYQFSLPN